MFGHFIVLLSNILLKFGAYIMSIFEKWLSYKFLN
jgi:hypothetical protein